MREAQKRPIPLDVDGFERISAPELLVKHRSSTVSRGDIVRTIATLEERLVELERQLAEKEEA